VTKETRQPTPLPEIRVLGATTLLKEYELCQNAAQSLESPIWQSGAAVGLGSIAFFISSVDKIDKTKNCHPIVFIGLFVILANIVWFLMARRWWSIQQANYLRMSHIEQELKIRKLQYLTYLDGYRIREWNHMVGCITKEELKRINQIEDDRLLHDNISQEKLESLKKRVVGSERCSLWGPHQALGVWKIARLFPWINAVIWVGYYLYCLRYIYH
jgi:hypothetical protein